LDSLLVPAGQLRLLYVTKKYDRAELVGTIKRLHVPGYDQARDCLAGAAAAAVYQQAEHLSTAYIDATLAWKVAKNVAA
jgi:hypothetical protein